jgi:hypothetical protein
MKRARSPLYSAIVPSAAAGPVFLLSLAATYAYGLVPRSIDVPLVYLPAFLLALVPATIIGFLLSYLPNAFGTFILSAAGEISEVGREPAVWLLVGAGLGFLIALLFDVAPDNDIGTFALVATSAISAGLCRAQTRWEPDQA